MGKEKLEMVCVYFVPPAAFAMSAIYWLSRITPQQMMTAAYPPEFGAVMLGLGLALVAAHVAIGKIRRGREG